MQNKEFTNTVLGVVLKVREEENLKLLSVKLWRLKNTQYNSAKGGSKSNILSTEMSPLLKQKTSRESDISYLIVVIR